MTFMSDLIHEYSFLHSVHISALENHLFVDPDHSYCF